MRTLTSASLKSRVMVFLMALVLMLGLAGELAPVLSGEALANGIFDVVTSSGSLSGNGGFSTSGSSNQSIATIIGKYKTVATAITGILTITMLIFMLIQFTKLGASGDNDMARKKAIMGILTTGIATALLGGATVVIGFFWTAIQ